MSENKVLGKMFGIRKRFESEQFRMSHYEGRRDLYQFVLLGSWSQRGTIGWAYDQVAGEKEYIQN